MKHKVTKSQVIIGTIAIIGAASFAYHQTSVANSINLFKSWDKEESVKEDIAEENRKQKEDFVSKQETNKPAAYCDKWEKTINNSMICNQKSIENNVETEIINGDFLTLGENGFFFSKEPNLKSIYGVFLIDRYKDSILPDTLKVEKTYMLSINQGELKSLDIFRNIIFINDAELGSSKAKKTTTIPSGLILNETKIATVPAFDKVLFTGEIGMVNNQLLTLSGNEFSNLKTIGQSFIFINNDKVTTLSGFNKTTSVGGRTSWVYDGVTIRGNDSLLSINGFKNLVNISGFINISDNNKLVSISGFSSLKKATGVIVDNNINLKDISGFKALKESHKMISLKNNPKLMDISPLSDVKTTELMIDTSKKYTKKLDSDGEMCFNIKHNLTSVLSEEKELKMLKNEEAYKILCQ